MSSFGRIASRSAKRRQYFKSCGNAVRKLAVQARLWKMAPDEMDTRYESLLRRCAATERRFQTTTVSDILARISDALKSTENQRSATSPDLIPCDIIKDAQDDAMISLEEDPTIDATQHVDDDSSLYLDGTKPAVVTIISPSSTSLSSSTEDESLMKHRPKKARTDHAQSGSPPRPKFRRMQRRTSSGSMACYPRMSWKRAHEVVQSRKRGSKRKRSPYMNRPPLETNPGWTPLQKAILKSGILRSPAPLPFICPDSPINIAQTDRPVESHQNSEQLIRNQEQINANVRNYDYSIEHNTTISELAAEIHTEGIPTDIGYRSPENHAVEAPRTPEVIISRRRLSLTESPSESIFSDSSRLGCHSDEDGDGIPSSGSLDGAEEDWSPTGTSTPICSAMKLLLHAEPFVPNLNKIDKTTLSGAQSSLKQCETPIKMPVKIQEIPGDDVNLLDMDQSLEIDNSVCLVPNFTQESTLKTNTEKNEVQSHIPVIIHGMVKEQHISSSVSKKDNVIDVKPTQSWMVRSCENNSKSQFNVKSQQMNQQNHQCGVGFAHAKIPGNIQKQPLIHQTPNMPFAGLVLVPHQVPVQQIRALQQSQVQFPMQNQQHGRPIQQPRQHQIIHQQWPQQQPQQHSNLAQIGMNQQRQLQQQQQQVWNTQHIQQQQRTQYPSFPRQLPNLQQQQQLIQQQQKLAAYRQQQSQQQQVCNGAGNRVVSLGNFSNQIQQHAGFNNNNYHQRPHVPPPQNYQLQQPIRPRFPNNCGIPPMANRPLPNIHLNRTSANMFQQPFQNAWQGRC